MTDSPVTLRYSQVDQNDDPELCVRFMDMARSTPDVAAARAAGLEALGLGPGMDVIELGCGTGDQARILAEHVLPGGRVIGVDYSQTMVAAAVARQERSATPATFEQGDVRKLRFADASFDACWTERMLCHVADPAEALAEIRRVLRPGGRLLAIDADAAGASIASADPATSAVIVGVMTSQVVHPHLGGALGGLLRAAGFVDVSTQPRLCRMPYEMLAALTQGHGAALIAAGAVTAGALAAWQDEQAAAEAAGTFSWTNRFFVGAGTKPA